MVRVDQHPLTIQAMHAGMDEPMIHRPQIQSRDHRIVCQTPQGNDHPRGAQLGT